MKRLFTAAIAIGLVAGIGTASADSYNGRYRGGYGHHDWRAGERVDRAEYRRWEYIDWRRHHLRRPHPGYEWRRYDGQFFEVALGDGRIGAVIRVR